MSSINLIGVGTDKPKDTNSTHAADVSPLKCPYCKQVDTTWSAWGLLAGKRQRTTGLEYHCYTAKCMD